MAKEACVKLKIIYRKKLNMSVGKIAAQAVHAATAINHAQLDLPVVVLGVSESKWEEMLPLFDCVIRDAGLTEVKPGTATCAAFYEK